MMRVIAILGWLLCHLNGKCILFHSHTIAADLKAGVARVDFTPPLELGSPLGGYGERMNRPAVGMHDRIFAKAIVFSNEKQKFCLLTADIVGFPPPLKKALVERLADAGWTEKQLMLLASHSHTSIDLNAINSANIFNIPQIGIYNPKVEAFVMERLEQAVRNAERQLVPVSVGTSSISIEGWNRNRRGASVTDPELTVTRIDTVQGGPLAALVNFTAHPTFLSGEDMSFSGDWPGQLQRSLESLIGDGVTTLYFNGAEGDQSPIARPDSGPSRWEQVEHYGRDLAIVAWKQWQQTSTQTRIDFAFSANTIKLPDLAAHPDFMKTGGTEYGLNKDSVKQILPRMFPTQIESISLRVGDLLIMGVPGELAASLGLRIKSEAKRICGAPNPVIGGLADAWIGYMLPTDEYQKGGYESSMSFYGETLGDAIVSGTLSGVDQLMRDHR